MSHSEVNRQGVWREASHAQRYLTAPRRHEVDDAFVIEREEAFAFAEKLRATE